MADENKDEPSRVSASIDLDMQFDESRLKEILACLAKGRLKITVSKVDLAAGRLGNGYLYD